jgi:hypothetical protein
MVFTNPIMTTRVNMIVATLALGSQSPKPLMNLMVVGGYISINVANFKRRISKTICCNYKNS